MNIYGLSYEVTTANRKTFIFFIFFFAIGMGSFFYRREEHVKENVNFPALSCICFK